MSEKDYIIVDNRNRNEMIELRKRCPKLAAAEKSSRAAAVELFCIHCMGGEIDEVRKCSAPLCPLFPWRPTSIETGKQTSDARREASIKNVEKARLARERIKSGA